MNTFWMEQHHDVMQGVPSRSGTTTGSIEQLTREIPADIPLDQAVEMIKAIAERQRAGLKSAGVLVDESDGNKIAIR